MSDTQLLVFKFSEPATHDQHKEIKQYLQNSTLMGYSILLLPHNLDMLNADEIEFQDLEELKEVLDYQLEEDESQ